LIQKALGAINAESLYFLLENLEGLVILGGLQVPGNANLPIGEVRG
jgi:hypothetical protein